MLTCSCGKQYKRLKPFQEHRALCEMIHLASAEEKKDHLLDIPSPTDMWLAMRVLIRKNAHLEKEVKKLRGWVSTQRKKLSVIDWLNDSPKPVLNYTNWIENITLDQEDLEMIFEHNFIGGMFHILCRQLPLHSDINHPLKAFDQKLNTLFVYDGEKWSVMDRDDFKNLVGLVHQKLQRQFTIYNKKNERLINNFNQNDTWYKNISKVMGGPLPYDISIGKINFKVYNYLKFNLRAVTKYEFTF